MPARIFLSVCGLFLVTVACATLIPNTPTAVSIPSKVEAPTPLSIPTATEIVAVTATPLPTLTPTATRLPAPTPGPGVLLLELDYAKRGLAFSQVLFSPDGRYLGLYLGNESAAEIWEVASRKSWRVELPSFQHVFRLAATDKAAWIIVYLPTQSGDLSVWQVSSAAETPTLLFDIFQSEHAFWIRKGEAGPAKVFDLTENEAELWVTDVAVSPDGKNFAVGYSAGELCLFRASDGKLLWRKATAHHDWVGSLVFSPNGRYLFSDSFSFDPFTYVWEAKTGKKLTTLAEESYEPMPGFFSVNSDLVAMQTIDGLQIFQTGSWKPLGLIDTPVSGLLTSNKNIPASVPLEPFELENGQQVFAFPPELAFLPDGRLLRLEVDDHAGLIRLYQLGPAP